MASSYTAIESALKARFLSVFSDELSDDRVGIGDPDSVVDAIFSKGEVYGVLFEYGGGREETSKPFTHPTWIWTILGVFFIRYDENVEMNMRAIVDKLKTLLDDDHTLGGTTPLAKFTIIEDAQPGAVNDTPFYWLPFSIEAIDR